MGGMAWWSSLKSCRSIHVHYISIPHEISDLSSSSNQQIWNGGFAFSFISRQWGTKPVPEADAPVSVTQPSKKFWATPSSIRFLMFSVLIGFDLTMDWVSFDARWWCLCMIVCQSPDVTRWRHAYIPTGSDRSCFLLCLVLVLCVLVYQRIGMNLGGLYIMSQQQAPLDGALSAAWSLDWRARRRLFGDPSSFYSKPQYLAILVQNQITIDLSGLSV